MLVMKSGQNIYIKKLLKISSIILFIIILTTGCSRQKKVYSLTIEKIGTFIQISVFTSGEKLADEAFNTVSNVFDEVNIQMSAHRDDSLLSRINQSSGIGPVKVPPEFFNLIEDSLMYSRKTNGAFDLTVGPVIRLYGFYRREGYLPSEEELKDALSRVGWRKVITDPKASAIFLSESGMSLDLGAIAKGYAVDRAINKLKALGVTDALVNAGGNLYALGDKGGEGWSVGIQHPIHNEKIYLTIEMKNRAVATSGCYQRFVTVGDKTYCHILDARTGLAINNGMQSATIVGPTAEDVDAIATCVMILGPEEGFSFLQKSAGFEGLILYSKPGEADKILEKRTKGFSKLIR
jgi:thiamine biosynthesis lipoprotein